MNKQESITIDFDKPMKEAVTASKRWKDGLCNLAKKKSMKEDAEEEKKA